MDKNKIIQVATRHVQKGHLDRAIAEYGKILREDPKDVRILLKVGELQQKKGDTATAAATLLQVAETYSADGFFLKAVAVYKQVLKLDAGLVDVNLKLAELYQQLGLMQDALAQYQLVAKHQEQAGNHAAAIETLRRVVDLAPDHLNGRIDLAELFAKEGRNAEAVQEFRRVAETLKAQGRAEDFLRVGERIVHLDPKDLALTRELANLYLARKDLKRGLAKLQGLFAVDPRNVETLELLGKTFLDLGQTSKAVSVYKELARVHVQEHRPDEAQLAWKKVLRVAPDDAEALAALATPVVAAPPPGRDGRAVPIGRIALQPAGGAPRRGAVPIPTVPAPPADETPAQAIERLIAETDVYVKYGLRDKAFDHLRRILDLDPDCIEAHERASTLFAAGGNQMAAWAELGTVCRICAKRGLIERGRPYYERLREEAPHLPELAELADDYMLSASHGPEVPEEFDPTELPIEDSDVIRLEPSDPGEFPEPSQGPLPFPTMDEPPPAPEPYGAPAAPPMARTPEPVPSARSPGPAGRPEVAFAEPPARRPVEDDEAIAAAMVSAGADQIVEDDGVRLPDEDVVDDLEAGEEFSPDDDWLIGSAAGDGEEPEKTGAVLSDDEAFGSFPGEEPAPSGGTAGEPAADAPPAIGGAEALPVGTILGLAGGDELDPGVGPVGIDELDALPAAPDLDGPEAAAAAGAARGEPAGPVAGEGEEIDLFAAANELFGDSLELEEGEPLDLVLPPGEPGEPVEFGSVGPEPLDGDEPMPAFAATDDEADEPLPVLAGTLLATDGGAPGPEARAAGRPAVEVVPSGEAEARFFEEAEELRSDPFADTLVTPGDAGGPFDEAEAVEDADPFAKTVVTPGAVAGAADEAEAVEDADPFAQTVVTPGTVAGAADEFEAVEDGDPFAKTVVTPDAALAAPADFGAEEPENGDPFAKTAVVLGDAAGPSAALEVEGADRFSTTVVPPDTDAAAPDETEAIEDAEAFALTAVTPGPDPEKTLAGVEAVEPEGEEPSVEPVVPPAEASRRSEDPGEARPAGTSAPIGSAAWVLGDLEDLDDPLAGTFDIPEEGRDPGPPAAPAPADGEPIFDLVEPLPASGAAAPAPPPEPAAPVDGPADDGLLELGDDDLLASDELPLLEPAVSAGPAGLLDVLGPPGSVASSDPEAAEPRDDAGTAAPPEEPLPAVSSSLEALQLDPEELADIETELDEAAFFLAQGLLAEAEDIGRSILFRAPGHPMALELLREVAARRGETPAAAPGASGAALAAELALDVDLEFEDEGALPLDEFQYRVEDVFAAFKKGVSQTVSPEDSQTHYDLGIAYKEMGLLTDAIEQFTTALAGWRGGPREVDGLSMLARCRSELGEHEEAIARLEEALALPGLEPPTRQALLFELAASREAQGDLEGALRHYAEVEREDPEFRGVGGLAERLRARLASARNNSPT